MNHRLMITALAAGFIIAGCSTRGNSSIMPSFDSTIVKPQALRAQIAVTTASSGSASPILIYAMGNPKNKPPYCKIDEANGSGSPAVDENGDLWVAIDSGGTSNLSSVVVEYKPNCGKAILTLQDPYAQVSGVAVAPNGTVYVANVTTGYGYNGDVLIYPKGRSMPSGYLGKHESFYPYAVGVDSANDVFVTYDAGSTDGIIVFDKGKGPGRQLKTLPTADYGVPLFDKSDNLILTKDAALEVYAPPYNGKPKTYALKGTSEQCSLSAAQSNIACTDQSHESVDVYDYPAITYRYSFSNGIDGEITGVAQAPI